MGNVSPPTDPRTYQRFVIALVQRYKGRIKYYEGWNEPGRFWNANNEKNWVPSRSCFFAGSPQQLVQLQSILYKEAKSIDPNCQILSPAFVGGITTDYDKFLSLGGRSFFDIAAHHFYCSYETNPNAPPEGIQPQVIAMRQELAKYHFPANITIVGTEAGSVSSGFDAALGSAYVARTYLVSAISGLKNLDFYAWNYSIPGTTPSTCLNLNDSNSNKVYAPGLAYQTIQNWLIGSTITSYTSSPTFWTVHLTLKNGKAARIVWRQDNRQSDFGVPPTWGNVAIDIDNNPVPIKDGKITVGAKPVLIY